MRSLHDVPAPAKLNLFLHVTGRRPDGYHLLQSAFVLLDWHDVLHFERRPGGGISREDIGAPLPADDLVVRAASALRQATGCAEGAHIVVDKRLPSQAGLGGGSSDAASCLLALNVLWRTRLAQAELERIGLELGADVPFFLRGRNAWVEGIGEAITPVQVPPSRFVVAKPRAGLETAAVFRDPQLRRDTEAAILSGFAANPLAYSSAACRNDLEPVARRLCPEVGQAIDWLASQGLAARMTGSGSAVFAPLPQGGQAPRAPQGAGWQVRECSSLEAHPLARWTEGKD